MSETRRPDEGRSVSVIVPTRDSGAVLAPCLRSIRNQTCPVEELIVCDGGSTDDTVAIAESNGAIVVHKPPNRSAQRNFGASHATGDYLVFIDSDMELTPRVIEDCVQTITDTEAALVIPEVFVGDGFWAAVRRHERRFYDGIWWVEAARFYRAEAFHAVGGFDEGMIGPEDWDLDQRIRTEGSVGRISALIEHNEGRTSLGRLLKKKAHYAGAMDTFAARHPDRARQALSPTQRVTLFARHPGRLAAHPVRTAGLVAMGLAEVAIVRGWLTRWSEESAERVASSA